MSVDLNAVPIGHPAEKQTLADLLTRLEQETDVPGVTQEQIDAAREEVSRNMVGEASMKVRTPAGYDFTTRGPLAACGRSN
jgi:hypothetical protein